MYQLTEKGQEQLDLLYEGNIILTEPEYSVLQAAKEGATLEDLIVAARFYKGLGTKSLGLRRSQPLEKAVRTVGKVLDRRLVEG